MQPAEFYESYRRRGFSFSQELLTRYCLSLYTKPFVLLSGISGTGKTKIAQLFEVPPPVPAAIPAPTPGARPTPILTLNITSGFRDGDGRGNLRFSDLPVLFEPDEITLIEQRIQALRLRGGDDNIIDPKTFTVVDANGTEFTLGVYVQRAASPLVRVRAKSKHKERPEYDSTLYIRTHYKTGDTLQLEKIAPGRLRIASVNNQAVIHASQRLQVQAAAAVPNQLFIAVRSNWTDGSELWGFYNMLDEKYHCTPLLKFILTAHEYPERPFFLILDEMNLSKVEHYFSDFLSCLESQEKIRLHHLDEGADSTDLYFDIIPSQVALPRNLYVTGTVNIDETTYMFSPKVLDRANVIEFNHVDPDSYEQLGAAVQDTFSLQSFPPFGLSRIAGSDAYRAAPPDFKRVVKELLHILQPYNLHFGYRVINEMALFVQNARNHIDENIIIEALDIQIYQKVLPKLNGNFGKLSEPLRKLIEYTSNNHLGFEEIAADASLIDTIDPASFPFPRTLTKLIGMYKNLIHNGFTSFLE